MNVVRLSQPLRKECSPARRRCPARQPRPTGGAALARSRRRRPRQAGRDARGRQSSARAPAISKIAPPGRNAQMGPAAALVGRIWPRRSSRRAVRRLAARPPTRLGANVRSRRTVGHAPLGVLGPTRSCAGLTRSSGPMAADAGRTHGRCPRTPPVHCALPWHRPTLGGPAQSRPSTEERVPRVGQCECKRHDRSDPWQIGWTALPRCDLASDAVAALSREGTPCTSRPGDDAT